MKIFLLGYMGSGKSTLAGPLSIGLGVKALDLDRYIEEEEGVSISEIFDNEGESIFREREADYLRQLTGASEHFVMAVGGGTPCYKYNLDFMNQAGMTIYLKVDAETLASRLSGFHEDRPLITGKDKQERIDFIKRGLEERGPIYEQSILTVGADKSVEQITAIILKEFSYSK
jgi:shikimate kinase